MHTRLGTPIWQHDAYTLRRLQQAITGEVGRLTAEGFLRKERSMVVDFGAGSAPYRSIFAPCCKQYVTCDLDGSEGVDIVFSEGEPVDIAAGEVDCVVSFQVLEHVWDVGFYLQECARLLGGDGKLLLSTHGTWLYHPHPGDYRRWTRDGLVRELAGNGLVVERVVPVVGALAWTTQVRMLAYHHVLSAIPVVGKALSAIMAIAMFARMYVEDMVTPRHVVADNAAVYVVVARRAIDR